MNFLTVCFALSMSFVLVSGQFFGTYDNAYRFGYDGGNDLNSFGSFGSFGGLGGSSASIRDSRQNRGPVVFPEPPADGPMESSGVIVGASGFGFVPPGGAQRPSQLSANRFNGRYTNQFRFF